MLMVLQNVQFFTLCSITDFTHFFGLLQLISAVTLMRTYICTYIHPVGHILSPYSGGIKQPQTLQIQPLIDFSSIPGE